MPCRASAISRRLLPRSEKRQQNRRTFGTCAANHIAGTGDPGNWQGFTRRGRVPERVQGRLAAEITVNQVDSRAVLPLHPQPARRFHKLPRKTRVGFDTFGGGKLSTVALMRGSARKSLTTPDARLSLIKYPSKSSIPSTLAKSRSVTKTCSTPESSVIKHSTGLLNGPELAFTPWLSRSSRAGCGAEQVHQACRTERCE